MCVIEAILSFDGTHVAELKAAVSGYDASEAPALIDFCESDNLGHRVAATWIVKGLLEMGAVTGLDLARVFDRLNHENAWEPLLHLLQSVQHADDAALPYRDAIRRCLAHEKTLVRVWALDALVRIALAHDAERADAREAVDAALSDPKASMRARARKLAPLLGL
ncbi:MAG: hypothetical protein AAF230_09215 [Pseudomonadota bacterium]